MSAGLGRLLRCLAPARLKAFVPVGTRARVCACLGLDVFPTAASWVRPRARYSMYA